jgi:hypothetical protein
MKRRGDVYFFLSFKNKKVCCARMAEWSKAVDLSPTISGCAGSNPASRIFFTMDWPL